MDTPADQPGTPEHRPPTAGDEGPATALRQHVLALQRTNRALRLLSSINQALMHVDSEAELIRQACEIAIDIGGYRFAWVGFAEHDDTKTVRHVCHAGEEQGDLHKLRFSWADDEANCDPTAMAVRSGQPVLQPDIAGLSSCAPWREAALACGYQSMIALPLQVDGQVIGALTLYGGVPYTFSPEELQLLTELAGDLSFGISALRLRARHRRAEEALRASEERYAKAFYTSPDAININRLSDGVYLDINQGFTDLTGFTREDVIGQASLAEGGIDIWVNPEDRQCLMTALREHGEMVGLEAEFRRKNGATGTGLMSARLIELNGEPCILSITRDITERKQVAVALRKSEALLRAVVDNAPFEFWARDTEGRCIMENKALVEHWGEMLGQRPEDADVPAEVLTVWLANNRRAFAGEVVKGEVEYNVNGERRTFENIVAPIYENQHLLGVMGFNIDITERKQAEEALRLTQFAVDRAGDMIFWLDFEGRLLYVNEASCRRMGYSREELLHMTVFDIDPIFPREGWAQHSERLRQQQSFRIETQHRTKMGELFPVEVSINYIEYNGKEYNFAFVRDVTERKRAEESLKEADRAKDQFLMMLSHELKTPLTSIIGWAQLAQSAPDVVPEALETILRNAHKQKILLERLLVLSRILTGKLVLASRPVDLWQLAAQAEHRLQQVAEEHQITFLREPVTEALRLEADGKLLEQAICEVLDNAVNFTPAGGRITIEGCREDETIVLEIRDSGRGIAAEQLSTLLTPFTQIHRKEEVGGLGIGLAVVRGIVEAHGGQVTISSAGPGQGTTVMFRLPRAIRE